MELKSGDKIHAELVKRLQQNQALDRALGDSGASYRRRVEIEVIEELLDIMEERQDSDHVGQCRSCGAEVYWCITEKGKRMPVDTVPADNGNLRLERSENEGDPPVAVYDSNQQNLLGENEARFLSHFASCTNAAGWRKGREAK